MAIEFNMVITNEGVDFAREASANANWHLIPKRYAIAATAGELSENRDYTSMLSAWTTNVMSSQLNGTNKIQNNVVVKANAATVDKQIGEIYFIYTNESNEEFLFAIAQPSKPLMFTPGVQQNYVFVFTLNNTNVQDIVEINYSFADDISTHNNDLDAHPYLLARNGSRTATGILKYASDLTFNSPLDIVNKKYVDNIKSYVDVEVPKAVPIGVVLPWMSKKSQMPDGFLLCNGAAVSRSAYAALYNCLGTTYGAGNGSTTFNIPDLRGAFLRGSGGSAAALGTKQNSAAPNIRGQVNWIFMKEGRGYSGALYLSQVWARGGGGGSTLSYQDVCIDASRSSSVYANGITEIRPVNYATQYIIKAL